MTTHYPDNDTVDVASPLQRERVPASSAHSGNRAASQPDNDRILEKSNPITNTQPEIQKSNPGRPAGGAIAWAGAGCIGPARH